MTVASLWSARTDPNDVAAHRGELDRTITFRAADRDATTCESRRVAAGSLRLARWERTNVAKRPMTMMINTGIK
jgi:hypothetical protein